MEDLRNHKFYYLLWLPKAKNIIWDAKNKKALAQNVLCEGFDLAGMLREEIDLGKWRKKYAQLYRKWLENDNKAIFDFEQAILKDILSAIRCVNEKLPPDLHFCYWYDLDRSENEDFVWTHSPISGDPLTDLGDDFFRESRMWDKNNGLLLPK